MSIDTTSEELSKSYSFFVSEIQPKIAPFEDQLNRKLNDVSYTKELEGDPAYSILFRSVRKSLELYQEKNIPIISAVDEESQKYGAIAIDYNIIGITVPMILFGTTLGVVIHKILPFSIILISLIIVLLYSTFKTFYS